MCKKDKPWFDDQCRRATDLKQEAHLRWTSDCSLVNWKEFFRCQVRANETYSEAKRQFSDRNRDVLMNVQSPHKWWSSLKSTVFGSSSSLTPVVSEGGGLVCELVFKAHLSPVNKMNDTHVFNNFLQRDVSNAFSQFNYFIPICPEISV